jgi:hypothetical protein
MSSYQSSIIHHCDDTEGRCSNGFPDVKIPCNTLTCIAVQWSLVHFTHTEGWKPEVEEVSLRHFDYTLDYPTIDFRQHPELYRIGKGEQGVLLVEPYKSEWLPHWRFKTPALARTSSETIYQMFLEYVQAGDVVGADMARKFLQMGWTRARRYANYQGGRKYTPQSGQKLPCVHDPIKAEAAAIFYDKYVAAREHPTYRRLRDAHRAQYETT